MEDVTAEKSAETEVSTDLTIINNAYAERRRNDIARRHKIT